MTNAVLSDSVEFVCPVCGLACESGFLDGELPAITHEVPICSTFDRLGVIDFLTLVARRIVQASKGGDA